MLRLARHLLLAVFFLVVAGCTGGGCSSGCACAGITPRMEGFQLAQRAENAASLRLTDSGLDFLEQNLGTLAGLLIGDDGGAVLTFEMPPSSQNLVIANVDICPDGPNPNATPPECVAEIDLATAQLQVSTVDPHNVAVTGPLPFRIQKLPVRVTWGICPLCFEENLDIVLNELGTCPGTDQPFQDLALNVDLSLEIDATQSHTRFGYSRLRILDFDVSQQDILAGIAYCGGGLTPAILAALDNFLMGFLFNSLVGSITGPMEDALCQQADPNQNPPCPDGSLNVDGICRYGINPTDECASSVLGVDGNINLASLLGSAGLGASGALDLLFAAGGHSLRDDGSGHHFGDLNPIAQGATVAMNGGAEPTPPSGCVPQADATVPLDIPIPDELLGNTLPDWPSNLEGPHFGFALSERFLNYALAELYNSGALCLGITADTLGDAVPLTTALIGLGLGLPEPRNSMEELAWQKRPAPMAIVLRPQTPPHIEIGGGTDVATDPLLHLTFDQLSLDFYAWSLDRYIRVMTATMDVALPVNLMVTPEGLQPVIDEIGISNTTVDHSALLRQEPALIATALEALLGGLVADFVGGALAPIDVNGLLGGMGLTLEIPPTEPGAGSPGLRKLTKGNDDFLGIFATLGAATSETTASAAQRATLPPVSSETTATLVGLELHPTGLRFDGSSFGPAPQARLRLGSSLDDGTRAIEWQYQLDRGPWHPFSTNRYLTVDDPWLRIQGRHVVRVRSRVVGQVQSLDPEPVEVVVLIDDEAPRVSIATDPEGRVTIRVSDTVSGPARTQVRLRLGDLVGGALEWGPWSVWVATEQLAPLEAWGAAFIDVQARDEDGNIGTVTQELIRGRGVADAGGCQCVPSGRQPSGSGWIPWLLAGAIGLSLGARRRRREASNRVAG